MPQPKQYEDTAARVAAYRERKRIAKVEAERIEREAQQTQWRERQALRQAAGQTVSGIIKRGLEQYHTVVSMEQAATDKLKRELTDADRATLRDEVESIRRSLGR